MYSDFIKDFLRYYRENGQFAPLRGLLAGGVWFDRAPQDCQTPYIVIKHGGSSIEEICSIPTKRIETTELNFDIYTDGDDAAETADIIARRLDENTHWQPFVEQENAFYKIIGISRTHTSAVGWLDDMFVVSLTYEVILSY